MEKTSTIDLLNDFQEGMEFESKVEAYLAWNTGWDSEPCANGLSFYCPGEHLKGRSCGPWCKVREARLAVEAGWTPQNRDIPDRHLAVCQACGENFADVTLPAPRGKRETKELCYPCAVEYLLRKCNERS